MGWTSEEHFVPKPYGPKSEMHLRKWEAQYVIQRGPISLTGGFFLSYSSYIYSAHVKSLSVKLAKI